MDLRSEQGVELIKQLCDQADVLIENFRPGTMEKWGLGPDSFKQSNPKLIYARISGYGQTGPYASKSGYASVCEGFGGFRHLNGFPDQAPVRPNLSIGDSIAGLHAALGILLALFEQKQNPNAEPVGQVVDVALYESIFNLLEAVIPEYDGAGEIRGPSGTTITGIVPTNTYACSDGKYVIIGGNGDSIFKRLMNAAGLPDMAQDAELANNAGRVQHEGKIDAALAAWCGSHTSSQIIDTLEQARVPCGPIYDAKDMLEDPHYQARGMFEQVEINGAPLNIPAILPKLSRTPGKTEWAGPDLGSHNHEIFSSLLNLDEKTLQSLSASKVI